MGFNSVQDALNLVNTSACQYVVWTKLATYQNTANLVFSTFKSTSISPTFGDAGGNYPVVGKTATVLSQSSSGAISFGLPYAGTSNYLVGMLLSVPSSINGYAMLVDRIVHCQLNLSETNGNFTGFSAVDRLSPTGSFGSGAQIWCEVSENFSNTISQFYFTYTNQDGIGSRQTPLITTIPSATIGNSITPTSGVYIALQGADSGVRSIESITFVSGSSIATGKYAVCLVKPIVTSPMYNFGVSSNTTCDYLTQLPCPEKIHDDAYLTWLMWSVNSAANAILWGTLQILCA